MTSGRQLLAEYVQYGSESAFGELVARYLDLVYSAAIRLTDGDAHRAEDVAQTVFADLARLGRKLGPEVMLGGWLHRHTCHVAATLSRSERRRKIRERQAVELNALNTQSDASLAQLRPIIDEAINQLKEEDRTAILLRFFEQHDFRAIGQALGTNEDAAQKRVSRALSKLHLVMARRGFSLPAGVLGTTLAIHAITAAPAGLAASICTTTLAGTAAGGAGTLSLLKIISMTKLKLGLMSVVVAGAATTVVMQYQTQTKLRGEIALLRLQSDELAQRASEHDQHATNLVGSNQDLAAEQLTELMRLRGEVSSLRRQTNELQKIQAENQKLRSAAASQVKASPKVQTDTLTDAVPKESWAFVGYGDPESAFQSTVWAMNQGETKTFLAGLLPGGAEHMRAEGKTDEQLAARIKSDFERVTAFRILEKQILSDDEVNLTVFALGINEGGTFKLQRIGSEWKFAGPVKNSSAQIEK